MSMINKHLPLPELIGLEGKMCAGKDFIADQLVSKLGYKRLNFADPLKQDIANRHNITVAELNARKAEFRSELQAYGANMRENVGEDYWVDRWFDMLLNVTGPVVVCDVRHKNEARILHERNAWLVQIRLPFEARLKRIRNLYGEPTQEQLTHESEVHIPGLLHHVMIPGDIPDNQIVDRLISLYNAWQFMGEPVNIDVAALPNLFGIVTS